MRGRLARPNSLLVHSLAEPRGKMQHVSMFVLMGLVFPFGTPLRVPPSGAIHLGHVCGPACQIDTAKPAKCLIPCLRLGATTDSFWDQAMLQVLWTQVHIVIGDVQKF